MKKIEMKNSEQLAFAFLSANGFKAIQAPWGVYARINGIKTEWCSRDGIIKLGIENNDADRLLISKALFNAGIVHYRKATIHIKPSMAEYQRVIEVMKTIKLK